MADRITVPRIMEMKGRERIAAITAYDYTSARIADRAGVDIILVGDSASNVVAGHPTTLPITLQEMLFMVRWARRGVGRALLVADMPFGSYQASLEEGIRSAVAFIKAGAEAVKLEGGREVAELVARLVELGIPVMGHVGLLPQRVHSYGGYPLQRDRAILQDAVEIAGAGAFSIVLEKVKASLAREITQRVGVPTIGIGSGPHCDGQILVFHDVLGLSEASLRFIKKYLEGGRLMEEALARYVQEVREGSFPPEGAWWD